MRKVILIVVPLDIRRFDVAGPWLVTQISSNIGPPTDSGASHATSRHQSLRISQLSRLTALAACSKKEDAPPPAASAPEAAPAAESPPAAKEANIIRASRSANFSAMALSDGAIELPNDNKVFGVGRTPEEVAAVLSANGLPTDKLKLTIQPLLVKSERSRVAVRHGSGRRCSGRALAELPKSLAEAGVDPQSVTDIFISHSHGDHVGGLVNAEGKLAFPNATIHLIKPEWTHMSGQDQYKALGSCAPGQGRRVCAGRRARSRRRESSRDQGPHAGPLGLPDHVRYRHSSICR